MKPVYKVLGQKGRQARSISSMQFILFSGSFAYCKSTADSNGVSNVRLRALTRKESSKSTPVLAAAFEIRVVAAAPHTKTRHRTHVVD